MPMSETMLIVLFARYSPPDGADQRERQRQHDGKRLAVALELRREHEEDEHDGHDHRHDEVAERLVHIIALARCTDGVAGRQIDIRRGICK